MKPNIILIIGSIVTIGLILLWHFNIIEEPIASLGGAVLTFIGYAMTNKNNNEKSINTATTINQTNTGTGDNVGRDKIVNN